MSAADQLLASYARYHRDPRNVLTHFLGIPLIVLSIGMLLSRPILFSVGQVAVVPAYFGALMVTLWYANLQLSGQLATLQRDLRGLVWATVVFFNLCLLSGSSLGLLLHDSGLVWGAALFVVGWILQFIGHIYEGRKPAFMDDLRGLLVGPMFVVAEGVFLLGGMKALQVSIIENAGPLQKKNNTTAV